MNQDEQACNRPYHNSRVAVAARRHAKLGVIVKGHVCIAVWPNARRRYQLLRGR
jgi:hypothetical protein